VIALPGFSLRTQTATNTTAQNASSEPSMLAV
jgi:hypothetical protein